jgi:hypothetical protein
MSSQVQFRRGTTTQNNAFTGAAGELSVDSTLNVLRLHDGTTAGGNAILSAVATQTALNKTFSTGSYWQGSPVALAYGGTGSNITANAGSVAYSTSNGLALTASGTSGQILVSGGIGAPTWVAPSSISAGTSTLAYAATNIAGGSAGQLIIQQDVSTTTFITAGAAGTFLKSAGAGYAPTWATGQVTIGSTSISLGNTSTSLAGLDVLASTGTNYWLIPVGTTAQRPGTPSAGMMRYNTDQVSYEGYSSGAWSSLGGVSAVNKFTYIRAETSAGAANGELEFFAQNSGVTAAVKVAGMNISRFLESTGTVLGTQTTQNLFNTVATTVNAFGAATAITLGNATSATLTLNPGTLVGSNTTQNLWNTTATTVNFAGAATSLYLGANSGTVTIGNPTVLGTQTTQNLFNTVATTVNFAGAATTLNIGAGTGTTTVNNNLTITGNLVVNGTTTTVNNETIVNTITVSTFDDTVRTRKSFSGSTSGTSATAITTFDKTVYRSGVIEIQVVNGTAYRILRLMFVHDGTNVTLSENYLDGTEVQTVTTNTTFSATIASNTITLYATCSSGTSAIKGESIAFKV